MDLFVKDLRQDGPLLIAVGMKRCGDSLAERTQAKQQLKLALAMQWRKRVKSSSLAPLQHAFSHLPDKTWAISASLEWLIGIDAACNSEFSQPYPLHKVFHPQELSRMEPAQIWSAKEAVAKAMGCGFDGVNPLDIRLHDVGLATAREQTWLLWSWRQDDGAWVTVAYQRKLSFATRRLLQENDRSKEGKTGCFMELI